MGMSKEERIRQEAEVLAKLEKFGRVEVHDVSRNEWMCEVYDDATNPHDAKYHADYSYGSDGEGGEFRSKLAAMKSCLKVCELGGVYADGLTWEGELPTNSIQSPGM